MTPEYEAALNAVSEVVALGYGLGLAFVALVLLVGSRGGEK